ncbi:hypothetical protein ACVMB0_007557 [Bradyrhizobium sp. USDA 4451]
MGRYVMSAIHTWFGRRSSCCAKIGICLVAQHQPRHSAAMPIFRINRCTLAIDLKPLNLQHRGQSPRAQERPGGEQLVETPHEVRSLSLAGRGGRQPPERASQATCIAGESTAPCRRDRALACSFSISRSRTSWLSRPPPRQGVKGPDRLIQRLLLPGADLVWVSLIALGQIGHRRLLRTASSAIFASAARSGSSFITGRTFLSPAEHSSRRSSTVVAI